VAGPHAGWFSATSRASIAPRIGSCRLYPLSQAYGFSLPFRSDDDPHVFYFLGLRRWPPGFWWLKKNHRGHSHRPIDRGLIGYRLHVPVGAGVGRMDMMCVALGMSGIAAFSGCARKSSFGDLASQAGVLRGPHTPLGLGACAGLIALTLYYVGAHSHRARGCGGCPYLKERLPGAPILLKIRLCLGPVLHKRSNA